MPDYLGWLAVPSGADGVKWLFFGFTCLFLPWMAYQSRKGFKNLDPETLRHFSRVGSYISSIIILLVLLALSVGTAWSHGLELIPIHIFTLRALVAFVILLSSVLTLLRIFLPVAVREPVLRYIIPTTKAEFVWFSALSLLAGLAEEIAFRGVLTSLLQQSWDSYWLATLVSALMFGLAHLLQGVRGVVVAACFGLVNQLVTGWTGSLLVAIVVHALYDIIAGYWLARYLRAEYKSP
ncbi:MAG: CPBP family intramembrane metalloprotease [Acidobacteria bacterium]|nr:CPBP family intramembrane metalloprotease [Acidobacteriota bacterium]